MSGPADMLLLADPEVIAVPLEECGEPLVDAAIAVPGLLIDDRKFDGSGDWRHVRQGVAKRLETAVESLPDGIHLALIEGYRPLALQEDYFAAYLKKLKTDAPGLSESEQFRLASRYVAPPTVAPHPAGAAVDVTLFAGRELDMGTSVNASPEESNGACFTGAEVSSQARMNREILSTAMNAAGFFNYPTEWWHWSFGDRYWALLSGARAALYGPLSRSLADRLQRRT